ncbi:MAG: LysM peptidoglycan-binding domain-containing protein [Pedosphaera sp.]|nr:LysM peptidoglycan-binding domain-containing protein [Pedosphaera sp.]
MKNPNPNIQPGMALEKASRGRSNMRVAVIVIVLAHVALFSGILFNACSQKSDEAKESQKVNVAENNQLPALPPPDGAGGTPAAGAGPATGGALPGAGGSNLPLPVPPGGVAGGATTPPLGGATGGTPALPTLGGPTAGATTPPPAAGASEHVIQQGDNFYLLAKKYNVRFKAIQDANPTVTPTKLQIGQKVSIPVSVATTPAPGGAGPNAGTPAAASDTYVVKKGDNLSTIAKRFGTSVKALREANSLQSERLMPEQKLKLPAGSKFSTAPAVPAPSTASGPINPGLE